MNSEKILDAISYIDDSFINETGKLRRKKEKTLLKRVFILSAAILVLASSICLPICLKIIKEDGRPYFSGEQTTNAILDDETAETNRSSADTFSTEKSEPVDTLTPSGDKRYPPDTTVIRVVSWGEGGFYGTVVQRKSTDNLPKSNAVFCSVPTDGLNIGDEVAVTYTIVPQETDSTGTYGLQPILSIGSMQKIKN